MNAALNLKFEYLCEPVCLEKVHTVLDFHPPKSTAEEPLLAEKSTIVEIRNLPQFFVKVCFQFALHILDFLFRIPLHLKENYLFMCRMISPNTCVSKCGIVVFWTAQT